MTEPIKTRSKFRILQDNLQRIFKSQWRSQSGEISDQINHQINKLAADIARKGLQTIDENFTNFGETAAAVVREWMENEEEGTHLEELEASPAKTITENIDNVEKIEEIYHPAIQEITQETDKNPSAPNKDEELSIAQGIIASLNERLGENLKKRKDLERINQELVSDVSSLINERDEEKAQTSKLKKDLEEVTWELQKQKKTNLWAEGLLKDNQSLKKQLEVTNEQISYYVKYKERAQELETQNRVLETKLKETEKIASKGNHIEIEFLKLQEQLTRLQTSEETLKAELRSAREHLQDNEELRDEVRNLREQATHMGEILKAQRQKEEAKGLGEYDETSLFQGRKKDRYLVTPPESPSFMPGREEGRHLMDHGYSPYKSILVEDSRRKIQKISSKELEKLPPYSGSNTNEMIDDYFTRLDRLIITSFDIPQHPEEENLLKASILLTKLADPARSHVDNTLTTTQKCDHREIISELKRRFEYGRDEYYYKQKLREIPGDGKRDFVEMVSTVESMVKNMLKYTNPDVKEGSPTHKTLFETYCRGWVEEKMSKTHLTFIKMQSPKMSYHSLKEAGARLDDINKTNKPVRVNAITSNTNRTEKMKTKEESENCRYCDRKGHQEQDCWKKFPEKIPKKNATSTPTNQSTRSQAEPTRRPDQENTPCDFCGRKGHKLVDCFQLEKYSKKAKEDQAFKMSLHCDHCKVNGHSTERCRRAPRPPNGPNTGSQA